MHSANPRGGTPISIAPVETAQREADWGQTTALSQMTAPCANAETPHRLEVAHCLYKHCLWLRGIQDILAYRLLPVKLLPMNSPRSVPSCCIDWTSSALNRANHATDVQLAGLRELPDYPTPQPRVNAPRPACLSPYPEIATSARLVAPILWKTSSSDAPTTTLDSASTASIPPSPCVVWKCPSTAVM